MSSFIAVNRIFRDTDPTTNTKCLYFTSTNHLVDF